MTPALIELSQRQLGVFTRAQALAIGISDDEIREHARRRRWCRIRRGAYTTPDVWAAADSVQRQVLGLQAATLQLQAPVVGSHETAAAVQSIELWEPSHEWIHVTRGDRSARREGGVWHHQTSLPAGDVVVVDGLRTTSLARTALDVARYAVDHEHAVVAVDSALRADGGTYASRTGALDAVRRMHLDQTDWPGARLAGGAVGAADPRCGSVGESRTRVRLAELGLPNPLTQVYVYDERGGLVGIADFALVERKTLVEFDGRIKYGLDGLRDEALSERLWAEKRREDRLRRLRWEIVRVVWADLYNPGRINAEVKDAAARAATTGPLRGSYTLESR
jgi:hypothetical protein